MTRPRLLDLFCCEGGAAVGYHRAGFDVIGVDIVPQPRYPFPMVVADALAPPFRLTDFDAIHASPPCQHFTAYRRVVTDITDRYDDLIEPTRAMLQASGLPYVIENVPGAPLTGSVTQLCGSAFGLDVRRHRLFETNWLMMAAACHHSVWTKRRYPGATNRTNGRYTCEVGVWRIPLEQQKAAMGIDWYVSLRGLSEAIPPAYTEHIGAQLLGYV